MIATHGVVRAAASSSIPVLLRGESGTGKGVLAAALHRSSPRAVAPFISVNCLALLDNLMIAELFGHTRGAFTGAVRVIEVLVPPLRERREDLLPLAEHLLAVASAAEGRPTPGLHPSAAAVLLTYSFPGNVRELKNEIERALILRGGAEITVATLSHRVRSEAPAAPALGSDVTLKDVAHMHIERALARCESFEMVARVLGVNPSTLWRKRQRYARARTHTCEAENSRTSGKRIAYFAPESSLKMAKPRSITMGVRIQKSKAFGVVVKSGDGGGCGGVDDGAWVCLEVCMVCFSKHEAIHRARRRDGPATTPSRRDGNTRVDAICTTRRSVIGKDARHPGVSAHVASRKPTSRRPTGMAIQSTLTIAGSREASPSSRLLPKVQRLDVFVEPLGLGRREEGLGACLSDFMAVQGASSVPHAGLPRGSGQADPATAVDP